MARVLRSCLLVALAAAMVGCPKKEVPQPGQEPRPSTRVAEGKVAALRASPDGAFLAYLTGCAALPPGLVPRGTQRCELRVVPATGGTAQLVAEGVTTLPHGFAWTPDGALLALDGYDHATGVGRLVQWDRSGGVRAIGDGVSFYAAAPGGRIGWVARGALSIARPGAAAGPVEGATRVATFEFAPSPDGAPSLLARRESDAGGELLAMARPGAAGAQLRTVAARAGDYRFSPRGDYAFTVREGEVEALAFARAGEKPAPLRRNVQSFSFAPGGGAIAFVADLAPGRQGDLWVAMLPATGAPSAPEKLAEGVGDFRWAAEATRLAWLERFDPAIRAGALATGGPGEKPVRLAEKVSAYDLSPDGTRVAFLEHVLAGGYSVNLVLARFGSGPAELQEIAKGVFGFELTPERDALWYRTACTQNGDVCDLYRVPASGLAAGAKPELLAQGIQTFDFDRLRPGRALLGWARADRASIDLGIWEKGKVTKVATAALPGSAALLGPEGTRLAYAVVAPGQEGVYVADVK